MNKKLIRWFFQKVQKIFVFLFVWSNRKKAEVDGQILIHSIPSTTVHENTEEMRKLWIGCRIDGRLSFKEGYYYPYEKTQPSLIKCFITGLGPCREALSKLHGDDAKNYIEFWQKWHEDWADEHERWAANYRIGCWRGMIFENQCFFFIPYKETLSNSQKKIWELLEYIGNHWYGGFQGIQL